ncbi:MAG: PilZ domain-containing protein [Thaumarchaeota archaeon]|nr:PilZ domain-containing protein [Nitrososphaerota archaeon]
MERRLHTRQRAHTQVVIRYGKGVRFKGNATNLSAGGVAIKTENLGLRIGSNVELAFIIKLGSIIKIHRRTAKVCHVHGGVTGLLMNSFIRARND